MESIGRLSSVIAHDFNNMLQGILGFTELLKEDVAEHPHLLHTVDSIEQTTARARTLTRQLLMFSRKQVYSPVPVLLSTFLSTLESLLATMLGKDVELIVSYAASATYVMADPSQIEQVLVNLAVNARDAKQAERRLRIAITQTVVERSALDQCVPLEGGQQDRLRVSLLRTMERVFSLRFSQKYSNRSLQQRRRTKERG